MRPSRRPSIPACALKVLIDNPAELEKQPGGDYSYFIGCPTVRLFQRCGPDIEIVHQGAVRWEEDPNTGTYRVDHIFSLRTPEGVYETMLPLLSPKVKEGQRGWQVQIHETAPRQKTRTTYGRLIHELQDEGVQVATQWLERYSPHEAIDYTKNLAGAYSLTLPEPEQKAG